MNAIFESKKLLSGMAKAILWLAIYCGTMGLSESNLRATGTIVGWGSGERPVFLPGTIFTKIAAGFSHNLALKTDGTVLAWGRSGPSAVPDGLNGVIAIAAGYRHNLALKSNGIVVAWGNNNDGQSSVPAGLNGVITIAAGLEHSLAAKSDGTVAAWGNNNYGESTCLTD